MRQSAGRLDAPATKLKAADGSEEEPEWRPILLEPVEITGACSPPVTSLLWSCSARWRFLTNHLKTNGFRRILEARIAREQGEKDPMRVDGGLTW
jgi:hypothetical protein